MMKFHFGVVRLTMMSAIALTAFSATAADIYAPAAPSGYKDGPCCFGTNWAGFYVGVNGGYGWSNDSNTLVWHNPDPANPTRSNPTGKLSPEGGFGGGQIGYNWQGAAFGPRVVFGVEADFQGAALNNKFLFTFPDASTVAAKENIDFFGTVRGRIGYAFDRTLVYATGGFAYGNVDLKVVGTNAAGIGPANNSSMNSGFVVGGGFEHAFSPAWSAKVEYKYIDLGSEVARGVNAAGDPRFTNSIQTNFSTVSVGLNYHLHQDYISLK